MFIAIRERMEREEGFTLIELLVVVIIIGILAAIAIPTFLRQRERGWAASAQSDARNAAIAAETYLTVNGTYAADTASMTTAGVVTNGTTVLAAGAFKPSNGVSTRVSWVSTAPNVYCITTRHASSDAADTAILLSNGNLTRLGTGTFPAGCAAP